MSFALTAAQRAVVLAEGNVLVDAGAGSGKTTTVVQLLLHALGVNVGSGDAVLAGASAPLSLDTLAAITFTNAAAADLVRKMRDALRKAGRPDLATDVDAARLGTIHGFCGELLRTYALRGSLPPGQRVLSDAEAGAVAAEAARDEVHLALERGDVPGLAELLRGRKLGDVIGWVSKAAQDADRLERWAIKGPELRAHELAMMTIATRTLARRRERLTALGALDFDSMIVGARNLLRNDDVRRAVQRRLRLLVIDEFQDVDPVQQEIAMLLAGLEISDPAPTRLVLVGDPKQSIYRFRRADVTLWGRTAQRFRAGAGQVLPLHENFRSKAAILGFVDHVVGELMDRPLAEDGTRQPFEVDFAPLVARAAHREGDACVELHVLEPDEKGKPLTANPVREAEHPAIATRLAALHDEFAWGRMAILVPGWKVADELHRALTVAGIPSYVPRGKGFWEAREVVDCVLLLRAVRDLADDTAVMGVLKSPFVGVRDATLLAIAKARGDGPLRDEPHRDEPHRDESHRDETLVDAAERAASSPSLYAGEGALLATAAQLLRRGAALRDRLSAAAFLERSIVETGFLAALALDPDGAQRIANVRKLLRLLEAGRDASLGEFLREVRDARAREDEVAPERLYGERGDVVTITTVHSAKGLEWDVVVLADLAGQLQEPKDTFCVGRETFAICEVSEDSKATDARHEELLAIESAEQFAERLRVWYVAATRAKHRMLLFTLPFGAHKKATSAAQHFMKVLGAPVVGSTYAYVNHLGAVFGATVQLADGVAPAAALRAAVASALTLPPLAHSAPLGSSRLSATQLMSFARAPQEWRSIYLHRVPMLAPSGKSRDAAVAIQRAIVTGQIVHSVLERLADGEADMDVVLEDAIAEWDDGAPSQRTEAGARLRAFLRGRVETVNAAPAWREVADAPGARRELGFTRLLADGTALVGAIDLIARVDGEVRIVDVKSSRAESAVLAERYGVQASVYLDAVRAIGGGVGARFSLVSAADGAETRVDGGQDVAALVRLMQSSH